MKSPFSANSIPLGRYSGFMVLAGLGVGMVMSGCTSEDKRRLSIFLETLRVVYRRAEVKAEPGNPGKTSYSLSGPGGAQTSLTVTGYAEDSVIGDLDNDGNSGDVALAMRSGNNVTVIRLVGDTLQGPVSYPTGTSPVSVAAGDVNGDGRMDLITANAGTYSAGQFTPGSLSVLLGQQAGGFGPASTLTAGTSPGDVGLGDFNGDGTLDLAVAVGSDLTGTDPTTRSLIVRLGQGNGAFGPEIPLATAQRTMALRVVDFNPGVDGHDDIVTTGSLLLGRGDGGFAAPVNLAPGLNPLVVEVADVNQDTAPDVVLVSVVNPNLTTVVLGHGDGSVDSPRHTVLGNAAYAVAYADENGDGIGDLYLSGGSESTLLPGRGDGTFQGVQGIPASPDLSGSQSASGAAVADFTGDGLPDVAVANGGTFYNDVLSGQATTILPGLGGGRLGNPMTVAGMPGYRVVTGDWNGDGKPDLASLASATTSSGTGGSRSVLVTAPGLGGGAFGPFTTTALPGPQTASPLPLSIMAASLNHDPHPDLLVGNLAVDEVSIFLGSGGGGFTAQAPITIGTAPVTFVGVGPPSLAVGDFNEDTHPDLVFATEGEFGKLNGGLKIAFGNGNGTFQSPQILRDSIAAKGVASADFNQDGHLDLALAMEYATFRWDVAIYRGRGDGAFDEPEALGLTETLLSGVLVLDADRDGKPDLALPVGGDELLGLRGLGNGRFARAIRAPLGTGGVALAADLNLDAWPDLIAPNGFLGIYLNELPSLGLQIPSLTIARHSTGKVALEWPSYFGDYTLSESPDLLTPFASSTRPTKTTGQTISLEINPAETPTMYFRLTPDPAIR